MISAMSDKETLLAIDTAGARLQLALATSGMVYVQTVDIAKGHAEIIFDQIKTLLERNQLSYQSLTRIAVTTGPGSFTGLRIGLSAARGLGLSLGIEIIGVPTLQAMSLSAPLGQKVAILLDARRNEAYVQSFSSPGTPADQAQLLPMEQARELFASHQHVMEPAFVDIEALARFATAADAKHFPPNPAYIRKADAKPQTRGKIAHAFEPVT